MENTQDTHSASSGKRLGTATARPELPDQENIAPGQVLVLLKVVTVLPVWDKSDAGPCGQSPCKAEVLVEKIMGYGPAFTANIAEGQTLAVHFPMTLQATEDQPAVTAGKKLEARLSQPAVGGTDFVMRRFTMRR